MARTHIMIRWLACGLFAVLLAAAMASSATAQTGGTAARKSPSPATPAGTPVLTPVGSTAGTITFVPAAVLQGHLTIAEGTLSTADAGQPVSLEIQQANGVWEAVATQNVAADGSFAIPWRASIPGQLNARVVTGALAASGSLVSTPQTTLSVMKVVIATWYGPGFYGHRTACGQTLTTHILGVAHRTLPCGTPVTLDYNGHTITVPVIDRGPYANGATFDLTSATAQALGIKETVNIGFTAQKGQKIAPTNWYPPGTGPTGASGTTGASGIAGVSGGATAPA